RGAQDLRVGGDYLRADGAVDPAATEVASAVARAVLGRWWDPPTELPHVMCALDEEVGLHGLEFQGRVGERGGIEYMLVFDVKGAEERDLLAAGRS
ncbi:MAG TPA: hypothetical protein VFU21_13595, partial [Kofleriaceae bacterium]|nr:hypothetical protein [Kofleriaceae bacterium]